jgi:hypothetical protein
MRARRSQEGWMRKWMPVAVASGLVASGCLSGFRRPLGPVEEGVVDSQLTGNWSCVSAEDPAPPTLLTIVDFDGRQYYLESLEEGKSDRGRYRGHATRVEGVPFLSIREVGGDDDEWNFMQYDLAENDRLTLQMVAPEPFEDVIDDPDRVRERLATRLQDPEIMSGVIECNRAEERGGEPR